MNIPNELRCQTCGKMHAVSAKMRLKSGQIVPMLVVTDFAQTTDDLIESVECQKCLDGKGDPNRSVEAIWRRIDPYARRVIQSRTVSPPKAGSTVRRAPPGGRTRSTLGTTAGRVIRPVKKKPVPTREPPKAVRVTPTQPKAQKVMPKKSPPKPKAKKPSRKRGSSVTMGLGDLGNLVIHDGKVDVSATLEAEGVKRTKAQLDRERKRDEQRRQSELARAKANAAQERKLKSKWASRFGRARKKIKASLELLPTIKDLKTAQGMVKQINAWAIWAAKDQTTHTADEVLERSGTSKAKLQEFLEQRELIEVSSSGPGPDNKNRIGNGCHADRTTGDQLECGPVRGIGKNVQVSVSRRDPSHAWPPKAHPSPKVRVIYPKGKRYAKGAWIEFLDDSNRHVDEYEGKPLVLFGKGSRARVSLKPTATEISGVEVSVVLYKERCYHHAGPDGAPKGSLLFWRNVKKNKAALDSWLRAWEREEYLQDVAPIEHACRKVVLGFLMGRFELPLQAHDVLDKQLSEAMMEAFDLDEVESIEPFTFDPINEPGSEAHLPPA